MSVSERVLVGVEPLDRYVEFVAGRCRPNTVIATVSDLRVFFSVIDRAPAEVTPLDVFEFIASQRRGSGDGRVVRLADGESGLAARTIKRRLASVSGLFNYLVLCGEMAANPVPRGMANRRRGAGGRATSSPLIRAQRAAVRRVERCPSGRAVEYRWSRTDRARREDPRRTGTRDVSSAAPHVPDPPARSGYGVGSDPGSGRAPVDRIDAGVSASRRRLARRRVSTCRGSDRRDRRDDPMTAA